MKVLEGRVGKTLGSSWLERHGDAKRPNTPPCLSHFQAAENLLLLLKPKCFELGGVALAFRNAVHDVGLCPSRKCSKFSPHHYCFRLTIIGNHGGKGSAAMAGGRFKSEVNEKTAALR